jgi:transmembrane protein
MEVAMSAITISRQIKQWLAKPATEFIARLALTCPFLLSGVSKLFDFQAAISEAEGMGLRPGNLFAAAVIVTQLGGSLLFLFRRFCWLGAGILAVFTLLATLLAHGFWEFAGMDRAHEMATFFEHIAIVGGFVVAAALVNGRSEVG